MDGALERGSCGGCCSWEVVFKRGLTRILWGLLLVGGGEQAELGGVDHVVGGQVCRHRHCSARLFEPGCHDIAVYTVRVMQRKWRFSELSGIEGGEALCVPAY